MSTHHAQTVILSDRRVDGTLAAELSWPKRPPDRPRRLDAAAFNFVKVLSEDLAGKTLHLPSLPEVAIKVRHALVSDPGNGPYVARIIGADPALAARVVSAVNAASDEGARPVRDLPTAVATLGLEHVYSLAMSMALDQVLRARVSDELRVMLRAEWEHSVRVASLAQALARSATGLNPDEAYLAGLLHSVGKLYILRRAAGYPELLANEQALSLVTSIWHHSVGFALINHWGLSLELARAVNDYDSFDAEAASPPSLTTVVHLADRLARGMRDGEAFELPLCRSLEIAEPAWRSIVTSAELDLQHLHHVLGL